MTMQQGWWQRLLGHWLLVGALLSSSGCMCFLHPVAPTLPELAQACQEVPECCRKHVYIFLVHGMDPFDFANLEGLRDYLHHLGFNKTYYGQLYHTAYFRKEMLRIHQEDPEARFVLVGFSFGANMVRNLTQAAGEAGINIDLLLYLGGNTLQNTPHDRPENALRLVNVLAHGYIWNGTQFDDAENISVEDVWHFGSPTHPHTLEALARNLAEIALLVRIIEPVATERKPGSQDEPTPRPDMPRATKEPDEWDFLKPVSQLRPGSGLSTPPAAAGNDAGREHVSARPTLANIAGKN